MPANDLQSYPYYNLISIFDAFCFYKFKKILMIDMKKMT